MKTPSFRFSPSGRLFTASNFALRLASLAGKMVLSIYMAKFFGLADLGVYGLAFGAVMIAVAVFGIRLDYVIAREIAGYDSASASRALGTTTAFFLANFALGALGLTVVAAFNTARVSEPVLALIFTLCCFESYANLLYNLTIALGRSTMANALFFVRSGLWTAPAIMFSWIDPHLRTAMFVLTCWIVGTGVSIVASLIFLRCKGIRADWSSRAGFSWLRQSLVQVFMVWVGSVAVTFGGYLDRFILAQFVNIDEVGVATFYLSFTTAVLTLTQSSTVAVSFPQLIRLYEAGDNDGYRAQFIRLAGLAAILSGVILLLLAVVVPAFAMVVHKPALLADLLGFVLLLVASWLRSNAESAYYLLFIERKHGSIWIGNLIFFVVSTAGNLVLIPPYGVSGLGAAAVIASAFLLAWRAGLGWPSGGRGAGARHRFAKPPLGGGGKAADPTEEPRRVSRAARCRGTLKTSALGWHRAADCLPNQVRREHL